MTVSRRVELGRLNFGEVIGLDSSTREFMKRRFRTGFDDVRMHVGEQASALCQEIEARAFTIGRDVYFGAGEYAPESESGRRLIAHELVHVLQQRSTDLGRISGFAAVGEVDADVEGEAERIASEVMNGGMRSMFTPDRAGVIRRAITLKPETAKMKVDVEGSSPYVDIVANQIAVHHLGRNSDVLVNGGHIDNEAEVSAINIRGEVDVVVGPKDDIGKWDFQFIQLARQKTVQAVYSGRKPGDGSAAIQYCWPPAFPAKFADDYLLDSFKDLHGKNVMPFTNLRTPTYNHKPKGVVTVVTDTDDHPSGRDKLIIDNSTTYAKNYLARFSRVVELVTVFVARDEAGVITPLAHVAWHVVWNAVFEWDWRSLTCSSSMRQATLTVHDMVKGGPTNPAVLAKIKQPNMNADETANSVGRAALRHINQFIDRGEGKRLGANYVESRKNFSIDAQTDPQVDENYFETP